MCRVQDGAATRSFSPVAFGSAPGTAALGRAYVRAGLTELGLSPEAVEIAVLLASELVANAVLHGAPPITVQVHVRRDRIRISVADESPTLPVMRDADPSGGWGMHLLERSAADWGLHEERVGKCVWFELLLDSEHRQHTS